MYADLSFVPIAREKIMQFQAPDPWADGVPAVWNVVLYQFQTRTVHPDYPPRGRHPLKQAYVGIHRAAHNRYRILPLGMQELWKENRLPPGEIPGLLRQIEEKLPIGAYPPAFAAMYFKLVSIMFTVLTLVVLGFYAWFESSGAAQESAAFLYVSIAMALITSIFLLLMRNNRARNRRVREQALALLANQRSSAASPGA